MMHIKIHIYISTSSNSAKQMRRGRRSGRSEAAVMRLSVGMNLIWIILINSVI